MKRLPGLETRGEPPKGVKFLGRLTTLDFSKIYVLVETQDAKAWLNMPLSGAM